MTKIGEIFLFGEDIGSKEYMELLGVLDHLHTEELIM